MILGGSVSVVDLAAFVLAVTRVFGKDVSCTIGFGIDFIFVGAIIYVGDPEGLDNWILSVNIDGLVVIT